MRASARACQVAHQDVGSTKKSPSRQQPAGHRGTTGRAGTWSRPAAVAQAVVPYGTTARRGRPRPARRAVARARQPSFIRTVPSALASNQICLAARGLGPCGPYRRSGIGDGREACPSSHPALKAELCGQYSIRYNGRCNGCYRARHGGPLWRPATGARYRTAARYSGPRFAAWSMSACPNSRSTTIPAVSPASAAWWNMKLLGDMPDVLFGSVNSSRPSAIKKPSRRA